MQPVDFLHPDFLSNDTAYRACQNFWHEVLAQVVPNLELRARWQPWFSETWGDDTPHSVDNGGFDGNPIVALINRASGRALRIIQEPPAGGLQSTPGERLIAYVQRHGDEPSLPREELVLVVVLSKKTLRASERLIAAWCNAGAPLAEIWPLIDSVQETFP